MVKREKRMKAVALKIMKMKKVFSALQSQRNQGTDNQKDASASLDGQEMSSTNESWLIQKLFWICKKCAYHDVA